MNCKKSECIVFEKSGEMLETGKKLSDYIKSLPLTPEQNNSLLPLILDHVEEAQRCVFAQGFRMGREFAEYERELDAGQTAGHAIEKPQ